MITQEYLKEILDYNPETGVFAWKLSKGAKGIGSVAGTKNNRGYFHIKINGRKYSTHRLAWLYVYGGFPENVIDHINGIKDDNRIINLRDVTQRKNCQNKQIHRQDHLIGTTYFKRDKKWQARIRINGKLKHLGYFDTEQLAHEAYMNKLKEFEK